MTRRFSGSSVPPIERGMMWSTVRSSLTPHFAHIVLFSSLHNRCCDDWQLSRQRLYRLFVPSFLCVARNTLRFHEQPLFLVTEPHLLWFLPCGTKSSPQSTHFFSFMYPVYHKKICHDCFLAIDDADCNVSSFLLRGIHTPRLFAVCLLFLSIRLGFCRCTAQRPCCGRCTMSR